MTSAEVTCPGPTEAEFGRSTIVIDGDGLRRPSNRRGHAALSLTLLGGLLILGGCSATPTASSASSNASTKSSICAGKPAKLTPITNATLANLPPSHDNDVGRRRIQDSYPDADIDANQFHKTGPCQMP